MADEANGANTSTIVAGHTLDYVEYCFGRGPGAAVALGRHRRDQRGRRSGQHPRQRDLGDRGLLSYQAASVPYNASGWTMEAYGTEGTLVASAAALPQITPIVLSGARGEDPLAPLDVPDRLSSVVAVPDGPGRNIARS